MSFDIVSFGVPYFQVVINLSQVPIELYFSLSPRENGEGRDCSIDAYESVILMCDSV